MSCKQTLLSTRSCLARDLRGSGAAVGPWPRSNPRACRTRAGSPPRPVPHFQFAETRRERAHSDDMVYHTPSVKAYRGYGPNPCSPHVQPGLRKKSLPLAFPNIGQFHRQSLDDILRPLQASEGATTTEPPPHKIKLSQWRRPRQGFCESRHEVSWLARTMNQQSRDMCAIESQPRLPWVRRPASVTGRTSAPARPLTPRQRGLTTYGKAARLSVPTAKI